MDHPLSWLSWLSWLSCATTSVAQCSGSVLSLSYKGCCLLQLSKYDLVRSIEREMSGDLKRSMKVSSLRAFCPYRRSAALPLAVVCHIR
jgi:hypothetical protein